MKLSQLKILSLAALVSFSIPGGVIPASAGQSYVASEITSVYNLQELQQALAQAADGETIVIARDIVLADAIYIDSALLSGKTITLKGANGPVKLIAEETNHICINEVTNVTLIFDNVILDGAGKAGGVNVLYSENLTLRNMVIQNTANFWGGAVSAADTSMTIAGGTLDHNTAEYSGGAIHSERSQLVMDQVTISNCSAKEDGGALRVFAGSLLLTNCDFHDNTSGFEGGAVAAVSSDIKLVDTKIINNKTVGKEDEVISSRHGSYVTDYERSRPGHGAGIYIDNLEQLQIRGKSVIKDNTADSYGTHLTNEDERLLHQRNVDATVIWSDGFDSVYNNHDVSYWWGEYAGF